MIFLKYAQDILRIEKWEYEREMKIVRWRQTDGSSAHIYLLWQNTNFSNLNSINYFLFPPVIFALFKLMGGENCWLEMEAHHNWIEIEN